MIMIMKTTELLQLQWPQHPRGQRLHSSNTRKRYCAVWCVCRAPFKAGGGAFRGVGFRAGNKVRGSLHWVDWLHNPWGLGVVPNVIEQGPDAPCDAEGATD